ncbi:immune inhibitor A domain-containing protein [Thermoflavimicrobium dichotomicum]|uniref:Immune inhibitor A n=1 Tax=Thermoflavimicrobium dichotomicum TaxID=46223 RepID=A0A1I3Q609_9BACL|nr:immune inhibitor A domain-containing protein [Thermoflavimicrobium dichotomicum]SFJ28847.1 immune inhibitor A [Thermoflavimicrobium dichotomicum]
MKRNRRIASLLSTSLVLGALVMVPVQGLAEEKPQGIQKSQSLGQVDWGVINEEALIKSLIKKGKLSKNPSPKEIENALKAYVNKDRVPSVTTDGIDTRTKAGKKAYKTKKALKKKVADRIANASDENAVNRYSSIKKKQFVDNGVVALIEFSDVKHNQIKKEDTNNWYSDYSPAHYQNLIFGDKGITLPDGKNGKTVKQYYLEQSAGYWVVDGKVTPWIQAKETAKYYGGHEGGMKDARPRELVKETLATIGKEIAGNEQKYDQRDPYDLDQDGNVMESDGLLDNLFVVHAGMGEEAGGGAQGEDAIWSHRWTLPEPTPIPGTNLKAFDYIIQPEDGAIGVFAHEYGHNLGLPDEYDTAYSGTGSPVEDWSIMSHGSWAGKIPGTEPTGFSPWAKLFFNQTYGGNWPAPKTIKFEELKGKKLLSLKEAVANTSEGKILKIDLPDRPLAPPTQPLGKKSYFSGKGDNLDNRMITPVLDLTQANTATLTFDLWRDIETDYDYLYINVYEENGTEPKRVKIYSDTKKEWEKQTVDLSEFKGKKIRIEFQYQTDGGLALEAAYIDNISVKANDQEIFADDAEGQAKLELKGFKVFDGAPVYFPNYYLVEYRTHNGVDKGLQQVGFAGNKITYDPGVVIWYYDGRYGEDNQTGNHPGEGFLGVVDSHQQGIFWSDNTPGTTRVQIKDAAFGFKTTPISITRDGKTLNYPGYPGVTLFDDRNDYSTPYNPSGGKLLPKLGLKIQVKVLGNAGAVVEVSKAKK